LIVLMHFANEGRSLHVYREDLVDFFEKSD